MNSKVSKTKKFTLGYVLKSIIGIGGLIYLLCYSWKIWDEEGDNKLFAILVIFIFINFIIPLLGYLIYRNNSKLKNDQLNK